MASILKVNTITKLTGSNVIVYDKKEKRNNYIKAIS